MPPISKRRIRDIGRALRQETQTPADLSDLNIYRLAHTPVMDTLISTIKQKLPKPQLIARRLKRLSSIKIKLKRFEGMELDRMQDFAGVRAVFLNEAQIDEFLRNLKKVYDKPRRALKIIKEYDYISTPKDDGYKSYHVVFEYCGKIKDSEKLRVELQLRTVLQHYWATAVEILALGTNTNLKIASLGDNGELYARFFLLASKLLSQSIEELEKAELKELIETYKILDKLNGLSVSSDAISQKSKTKDYILMLLNYATKRLSLLEFNEADLDAALKSYQAFEADEKYEVALISVSDIKKLKKAYPNYYLDAKNFTSEIKNRLF